MQIAIKKIEATRDKKIDYLTKQEKKFCKTPFKCPESEWEWNRRMMEFYAEHRKLATREYYGKVQDLCRNPIQ